MKFPFYSLSKILFTLLIIFFTSQFASALNICPGQPANLTWGITSGTVTACNTKNSNNSNCQFDSNDPNQGGPKTMTLTLGSCTVNFQCENGTKADGTPNYSNLGSDTLYVVDKGDEWNGSACVCKAATPSWDGTTCVNRDPTGNHDLVSISGNTPVTWGWAINQDTPDTAVSIHFYIDGPAGSGVYAGQTSANVYRADGGIGNHGFEWNIPTSYH